jgi:hypothetical protein
MMHKTVICSPKEIPLHFNQASKMELTGHVLIHNLQLVINCGKHMLNKHVRIRAIGESGEAFDFGIIQLTTDHNLPVDTELSTLQKYKWLVKYLLIEPCQDDNYPIFIGINSLNIPS